MLLLDFTPYRIMFRHEITLPVDVVMGTPVCQESVTEYVQQVEEYLRTM